MQSATLVDDGSSSTLHIGSLTNLGFSLKKRAQVPLTFFLISMMIRIDQPVTFCYHGNVFLETNPWFWYALMREI